MGPSKAIPAVSVPNAPTLDSEADARRKAEARAYALSSSSSRPSKRKNAPTTQTTTPRALLAGKSPGQVDKPTSLSIRRPDRASKLHKTSNKLPPLPATTLPSSQEQPTANFASLKEGNTHTDVIIEDTDDEYQIFVKSLGLDDSLFAALDNDDEEFHLSEVEDDDDEDDDEGAGAGSIDFPQCPISATPIDPDKAEDSTPPLSSPLSSSPMTLPDFETEVYKDLEEELGSLLEEDMEAAVRSLMTSKKPGTPSQNIKTPSGTSHSPKDMRTTDKSLSKDASRPKSESPATPLRETARQGTRTQVTYRQSQQLRRLLTRHYQTLVQQAVLAVRAAQMQKLHKEKSDFLSGETSDDLAEILDGAVGMLQDLDQNRKDAIRNSIQMTQTLSDGRSSLKGRRSLLPRLTESSEDSTGKQLKDRPLTRAAFTRTLEEHSVVGTKRTAFDIPGLVNLKDTFATIDKSVEGVEGSDNILELPTHAGACKLVLRQAGAHYDEGFIPGMGDLSENFCDPKEIFGAMFQPPCTEEQQALLRRNRNLFTSGEDNLVLRGVNLYGEKQWILIADRYLPDRSVNIISQRYSKLCVMLYKANGIFIDGKGKLEAPPKLESVDDIDEAKVKELELETVEPPAILNVHRWSLEEDLTLLKAVPIMGHMWAELGARLIPHRDRGHLRKRYQVLERRVKATVARTSKLDSIGQKSQRFQPASRKGNTNTAQTKQAVPRGPRPGPSRSGSKKATPTSNVSISQQPPMSIEKAAASLTYLRPPREDDVEENLCSPSEGGNTSGGTTACSTASAVPDICANPDLPSESATKSTVPLKGTDLKPLTNVNTATSRAAFERLVDGASEEWSQMSRMQSMLENGTESRHADATVNDLVRSPLHGMTSSTLPQIQLESSLSGLSFLQFDTSKLSSGKAENKSTEMSGESILTRVLCASAKSNSSAGDAAPASGDTHQANAESPRKRQKLQPSTTIAPSTPKRTNFFSAHGTPIGLSPGFRHSPTRRNGGSIPLTPNVSYSPAPSAVMRLMSEPSVDEIQFCDFQLSEASRNELEGVLEEQAHDPTPPPLTPSKNSLMLDDLEAISALNSLSNSPFRPSKKRKENSNGPPAKKSLFATVVGNGKEKDPKTRLQF